MHYLQIITRTISFLSYTHSVGSYSQVMEKPGKLMFLMALQDMARTEPDLTGSRALATDYLMLSCLSVE